MPSPFFPSFPRCRGATFRSRFTESGRVFVRWDGRDQKIFTQQQTDKPADTQVQTWQRKHARLGYSYGPHFPSRFVFLLCTQHLPRRLHQTSSLFLVYFLFRKVTLHELASIYLPESLSWKAASCSSKQKVTCLEWNRRFSIVFIRLSHWTISWLT